MQIDIYKKSGHRKGECQDQIVNTENSITICDGCSTTALPDLGANLMALAGLNFGQGKVSPQLDEKLEPLYKSLGLEPQAMLSTFIRLLISKDKKLAHVNIVGDGCWFYVTNDNRLYAYSVEFEWNAPYFYQYSFDPYCIEAWKNTNQKIAFQDLTSSLPLEDQWNEPTDYTEFAVEIPLENVKLVGIASDGITSFIKNESYEQGKKIRLPTNDILQDMLSFKNPYGEFLKRTVKKVIEKIEKEGGQHYDDISIGVVLLDPEGGLPF